LDERGESYLNSKDVTKTSMKALKELPQNYARESQTCI
jgi:hypothetical protein